MFLFPSISSHFLPFDLSLSPLYLYNPRAPFSLITHTPLKLVNPPPSATMRTMVDLGRTTATATTPNSTLISIMDTPTSVDCSHTIPYRRSSFRSLIQCMAPCFFSPSYPHHHHHHHDNHHRGVSTPSPPNGGADSVTITFFGHRRGKRVNLCIQHHARTLLFLQLSVPTAYLAREMQSGVLRITLACSGDEQDCLRRESLYEVPVWRMYWNGRKVGYGVRREKEIRGGCGSEEEGVLRVMRKVSVGAGVVRSEGAGGGAEEDDEVMYMRARFERVVGSPDVEAFYMINPVGCVGQELSVFLLRS